MYVGFMSYQAEYIKGKLNEIVGMPAEKMHG